MLKPKTLKEAISLARKKDDRLSHQKKTTCPSIASISNTASSIIKSASTMKQLNWEEMQKRRVETTNSRLVLQL